MSFRKQPPPRKTHIVVVTPAFTSPAGGIARVAGELITLISRRTAIRFTWVGHGGVPKRRNANDPKRPAPPSQIRLPMRGWSLAENALGVAWPFWDRDSLRALRQAIFTADLVWIHGTLYPGAWAAYRFAKILRKPVLATQHESPSLHMARGNPLRYAAVKLADMLMTARLLRRARQVVFTSNAAARYYRKRAFKTPTKVIPNGVEGEIFHPPSTEDYRNLRSRFALRDDQPVLLFAGRFDTASGLPIIRRLAQHLPRWRFWLAGHGRVKPESWYLPNVQVFRDRTGERLADLFKAADLLIMPGVDPESPHVLQQALACQLPVMCAPAVVAGHAVAARCLVVNTNPASPEETAKHWVQKLKAGKDAWPAQPNADVPFDTSWDWLQVAAHYTEILQELSRAAT
jgi:glycosyltransferase involved in cell wall biosynthesis